MTTKKYEKALETLYLGAAAFLGTQGDDHVLLSGLDLATKFVDVCVQAAIPFDQERGISS